MLNAATLNLPVSSPTTLAVTSSPNPAYVGEPVTFTFTVTPGPDMGTISEAPDPSGPFTPIATIDPATGTATFIRTYPSGGTREGWYQFDGVPGFARSPLVYFEQPTAKRPTTTTASPAAVTVGRGDPLTITATILPVPAHGGGAGSALLRDGGTVGDGRWVGGKRNVDPVSGVVTFITNNLAIGHHDLFVDFEGTNYFAASSSAAVDVTVFDRPTTTTVSVSPNPSMWGENNHHRDGEPHHRRWRRCQADAEWRRPRLGDDELGNGRRHVRPMVRRPRAYEILAEFVPAGSTYRWAPSSATVAQVITSTPIDTDAPVGSVTINGGDALTTDGYVVVSMHATDASGMSVSMSCDGVDWQGGGTIDGDVGWGFGNPSCSPQQGPKTVYVRWVDDYGNTTIASDSIILENAPPSGLVIVSGGEPFVSTETVSLDVSATDAATGVAEVGLSNDGTAWTTRPYAPTQSWQLSSGDGNKTVQVKWRDGYGNWSEPVADTIALDRSGPTGSVSIAGGAGSTSSPTVSLSVQAIDAVSGVAEVALSNDGSAWTTRTYASTQAWTLTTGTGVKTVYAKWRDAAGNWSDPASDTINLIASVPDAVAPVATLPRNSFVTGSILGTRPPVLFSWTGSDALSGIGHYEFGLSTDGHAYTATNSSLASPTLTLGLTAGHTYRARVRAVDVAGNIGAWVYGTSFKLSAYQESSRSITFTGSWKTGNSTAFWGGHDRYASGAGARATLTLTGRSFAWLGSTGPSRGYAKVYVNGVLVKTINLNAATTTNHKILFATTWSSSASRTVSIRISGTAGHPRGDVDALIVGS